MIIIVIIYNNMIISFVKQKLFWNYALNWNHNLLKNNLAIDFIKNMCTCSLLSKSL